MTNRIKLRCLCAAYLVFALYGCNAFEKLRGFFHPEDVTSDKPAQVSVEVEPADGIQIFLDGRQVARFSPHTIDQVSPGEHTLEIRAKGYHTFVLPFKLYSGQNISIPVQLRKATTSASKAQKAQSSKGHRGTVLRLIVDPKVPIILNGSPQNTTTLLLRAHEGHLTAGSILLHYKLRPDGLYEFVLPGDNGTWARNGKVVDSASRFTLGGKEIQLYRVGMGDRKQLLVIQSGQQ